MVVALLRCIPSVPSRREAFVAQQDATCPAASLICSVAGRRPVVPWPAQRICFASRTLLTLAPISLWCCLCLLIQSADLRTHRASKGTGPHACYQKFRIRCHGGLLLHLYLLKKLLFHIHLNIHIIHIYIIHIIHIIQSHTLKTYLYNLYTPCTSYCTLIHIIHIHLLCIFFRRRKPTKQEEIQLLHRHNAHDGGDAASKRKQARQGVASNAAQGP